MATQDGHSPIFIDSHAHLPDAAFGGDLDEVISRARGAGAAAIICIGESLAAASAAAGIARDNSGFVFSTAGIHPHDAAAFDAGRDVASPGTNPANWAVFNAGRNTPEMRSVMSAGAGGVGEGGLDSHYDNSPPAAQRGTFSAQGARAAETRKPVVVHTRDAEDDT